jgi:hypothetical protein
MGLLGANVRDLTSWGCGNDVEKVGKQQQQVLDAIALAVNQDDRDGELWQMLLKGQILINCHEDVELSLSQSEELAVGDARPALAQDGLRIEARNVGCKTSVDALV